MRFDHRPDIVYATPDGTRIVVGDNRAVCTIIDPRSRRKVAAFTANGGPFGFTADGRQVLTYGGPSRLSQDADIGQLVAYDVPSGRVHPISAAGDLHVPPAATDDGAWAVVATRQHSAAGTAIDVFDSRNWDLRPRAFTVPGRVVAIAAGHTAVAVESDSGSIVVRALPSSAVLGTLALHGTAPVLAVSPDGTHVLRSDPTDRRRTLIYDVRRPTAPPLALPLQPSNVQSAAFAPGGNQLAVTDTVGTVATYGTNGAQIAALSGHSGAVVGLTWSGTSTPTGLYTSSLDGNVIAWDLASRPDLLRQSGPSHIAPVHLARSGALVIGDAQPPDTELRSHRMLFTLDLRTGRYASWREGLRDDEGVQSINATADGRLGVVSIGTVAGPHAGDNRMELVDLHRHDTIAQLALPASAAHFSVGLSATFSPDGRTVLAGVARNRVGVFAVPSGRYLRSFEVDFAPPDDARVQVLPWTTDPAGRLLVEGFDGGTDPANPWAKAGDDKPPNMRLGLVDTRRGRLVAQLGLGDIVDVASVGWSRDGSRFAVGTWDGGLAVYDGNTLRPQVNAGIIDAGAVQGIDFSPDGRTLMTVGTAVRLWGLPDLTPEGGGVPVAADGGPTWAWYTPGGDVTGLGPNLDVPGSAAYRWLRLDARPATLLATACRLAGGDMTRAQWRRYLGDRPFRTVCR